MELFFGGAVEDEGEEGAVGDEEVGELEVEKFAANRSTTFGCSAYRDSTTGEVRGIAEIGLGATVHLGDRKSVTFRTEGLHTDGIVGELSAVRGLRGSRCPGHARRSIGRWAVAGK